MNILKKIATGFLILITLVVVIILIWLAWQYLQDPLNFINKEIGQITVTQDSTFSASIIPQIRTYHKTRLYTPEIGEIRCFISIPPEVPEQGLPVVIILGGLEENLRTMTHIPDPGQNIIIVYQYPYHPQYWYSGTAINEVPIIRKSVLNVPAQVLALTKWTITQNWSDNKRIIISGYSFGAFFIPAIYRLAYMHGLQLDFGVIVYGGADLYRLLVTNMTTVSQPLRSIISWFAITSIRGVEPALHAPYLKGEFLLINGKRDHQIPAVCWQKLHRLVPEPKTIMILDENHMHPRKVDLTRRLVSITQQWLLEKNVINP